MPALCMFLRSAVHVHADLFLRDMLSQRISEIVNSFDLHDLHITCTHALLQPQLTQLNVPEFPQSTSPGH